MDIYTKDAITRMVKYIADDAKIARMVAIPAQGITAAHVAAVRRSEIALGRMPACRMIIRRVAAAETEMAAHDRAQDAVRDNTRLLAQAIRGMKHRAAAN